MMWLRCVESNQSMSKENTEFAKTLISNETSNSVSVSLSAHKHEYERVVTPK